MTAAELAPRLQRDRNDLATSSERTLLLIIAETDRELTRHRAQRAALGLVIRDESARLEVALRLAQTTRPREVDSREALNRSARASQAVYDAPTTGGK